MDGLINSDPSMAANKAFDMILSCVQKSCLNYHVQLSPFSAVISVKKTLMKTLDGMPLFPKISESEAKTEHYELSILKEKYTNLLCRYERAEETIGSLKKDRILRDNTINELLVMSYEYVSFSS